MNVIDRWVTAHRRTVNLREAPDHSVLAGTKSPADLCARIEAMGRDIESRVTGIDSKKPTSEGEQAGSSPAAGYGSPARHQALAAALAGRATDEQIKGRLAAERSDRAHPRASLASKAPSKARKTSPDAALGTQRTKSGPSR